MPSNKQINYREKKGKAIDPQNSISKTTQRAFHASCIFLVPLGEQNFSNLSKQKPCYFIKYNHLSR